PVNCLQYFVDLDGTVKSFNSGRQQLNNLEYSVCIASYEGVGKIQWKQCKDPSKPRTLQNNCTNAQF
ncbi:unnamed protein product, partial [Allacma fusca]